MSGRKCWFEGIFAVAGLASGMVSIWRTAGRLSSWQAEFMQKENEEPDKSSAPLVGGGRVEFDRLCGGPAPGRDEDGGSDARSQSVQVISQPTMTTAAEWRIL